MLEAYGFEIGQLLFFFSILLKMIFFHAIVRLAASVSFSRRQHQATAGSVAVFI